MGMGTNAPGCVARHLKATNRSAKRYGYMIGMDLEIVNKSRRLEPF
jgi:hypothetical protein